MAASVAMQQPAAWPAPQQAWLAYAPHDFSPFAGASLPAQAYHATPPAVPWLPAAPPPALPAAAPVPPPASPAPLCTHSAGGDSDEGFCYSCMLERSSTPPSPPSPASLPPAAFALPRGPSESLPVARSSSLLPSLSPDLLPSASLPLVRGPSAALAQSGSPGLHPLARARTADFSLHASRTLPASFPAADPVHGFPPGMPYAQGGSPGLHPFPAHQYPAGNQAVSLKLKQYRREQARKIEEVRRRGEAERGNGLKKAFSV